MGFIDRRDAGVQLGMACQRFAQEQPVVLGLVRGGIPVAYEVAAALHAPLDALGVKKVGMPGNPELALGAVSEGDVVTIDRGMQAYAGITDEGVERYISDARRKLRERMQAIRREIPLLPIRGRVVIVVDDGIATGATMKAALETIRARDAARIILAVPLAAPSALAPCRDLVDEVICLLEPSGFGAVGEWYEDFAPTSDAQVVRLLQLQRAAVPAVAPASGPATITQSVAIPVEGPLRLDGELVVPEGARALIVFAHGAGSDRHSPRNTFVAEHLARRGYASLRMDLLSPDERLEHDKGFAFPLLASRVRAGLDWISEQPALRDLPLVLYGASTGAAVAMLVAATDRRVAAVVSRGGRADLVQSVVDTVHAPCLFIVGSEDEVVLDLTRPVVAALGRRAALTVIPGAGHLFEEPGTLDAVCEVTGTWLDEVLTPAPQATGHRS
jgi:putative phosphoribosyl transferase